MTIEIKRNAAETIIEAVGRLDTTTAPMLDKTINEDIEGTVNLVLDLKGIEYISSAGLRVLLSAQKKMQKAAKEMDFLEAARYRDEMFALEKVLKNKG